MCGIAGYIGHRPLDPARIDPTLRLMRRRGPDHQAADRFEDRGRHVALLHSRLGIIDLDPRSHQPMAAGGCTLILNGELYNYIEIRSELQAAGVPFHTRSDTEVLLKAWLHWGRAALDRLEGMWAFALYDRRDGSLSLCRDRFGEKPLFIWSADDGLYFGSQTTFLASLAGRRPPVNRNHLARLLAHGYKSLYKTSDTFFEPIRAVPPATILTIGRGGGTDGTGGTIDMDDRDGMGGTGKQQPARADARTHDALTVQSSLYWQPRVEPRSMSLQQAADGVRDRLADSLRIRLRSDVPLAICLSGGVDSGGLASLAARRLDCDVHAVALLDADPRYDESPGIRATLEDLGCRYTLVDIPRRRTLEQLQKLVEYHAAPLPTLTSLLHSWLMEAVAAAGCRIAVSGIGADELFTGYYDHFPLHLYEIRDNPDHAARQAEWRRHVLPQVRNPLLQDPDRYFKDPGARDHIYFREDVFADCLVEGFDEPFIEARCCDSLLRNRLLNELFHEVVPVVLHEDDLNAMYYSVENRSPYLDRRLMEFACSIPAEHLIAGGRAKHVLREALSGALNDRVRLDRRKVGFNTSIDSLLDFADPSVRSLFLDDGPIFEIVRRDRIEALLRRTERPNSESKFLFTLLTVRLFLDMCS